MEKEVLEGATKSLNKHKPIIYIENDRIEKSKD
ncbi:MAG: FkbM family methyltransferase, partial [Epsilonproteobacteria bacterium]|nr:FkbM family methyltransferase [Campylobacterota bacterium]